MEKVSLEMMFTLKKGMKLRMPDGKEIELTSNYMSDFVGYMCREIGSDSEEERLSSLYVSGCEIL